MLSLPLPLPSLLRVIPIYCAYWNQVKGGSDTTTKLMDDCYLYPPRQHTNAQSIAVARCISLLLVFVHRHIQIFSSKKCYADYASLGRFRNAASQRSTYYETLLDLKIFFAKELANLNKKENEENNTSHTHHTPSALRRSNRNNRVNGITPQQVSFVSKVTGFTPAAPGKRGRQSIERGKTSVLVEERMGECSGRPAKIHKFGGKNNKRFRGTCSVCLAKTSFFCVGCKLWYCLEANSTNTKDKNKETGSTSNRSFQCFAVTMPQQKAKGGKRQDRQNSRTNNNASSLKEKEHFEISCFIKKHREAWEKGAISNSGTSSHCPNP